MHLCSSLRSKLAARQPRRTLGWWRHLRVSCPSCLMDDFAFLPVCFYEIAGLIRPVCLRSNRLEKAKCENEDNHRNFWSCTWLRKQNWVLLLLIKRGGGRSGTGIRGRGALQIVGLEENFFVSWGIWITMNTEQWRRNTAIKEMFCIIGNTVINERSRIVENTAINEMSCVVGIRQ